jgi:hypothetical protein
MCPSCTATLNEDDERVIRFRGVLTGPGFTLSSTLDLSSELGVYGAQFDKDLVLEEGCRVDFLCPHCDRDFTTSYNPDLAEIEMIEEGQEFVVVFSKIYGQHTSLVVDYSTKKLIASYGKDADAYVDELGKSINFFGS